MFLASILVCVAEAEIRVMPLGDSITRGYYISAGHNGYRKLLYLSLISGGYNCDFVGSQTDGDADPNHEGHGGQIASWLNLRMNGPTEYWLSTYQPDIILYHIGTNNLVGSDIATYAQDANETLEIIYNFDSDTTVVLAKIILTRDDPARDIRTQNYNLLLENISQVWKDAGYSIILVNMESALNDSTDMGDPLHPNDVGYSKMADVWYQALDNLLAAPIITSTPQTNGDMGVPYIYDVDANGYPEPTYSLTVYPAGMTINPNTGLINWAPTAIGDFNVTVEATNYVADTNQSFTITIPTIIEFDAASSATSGDVSGDTLTWSHTVGNGSNRILVVGAACEKNGGNDNFLTISSLTYGAASMSPVAGSGIMVPASGHRVKTELYYLLAPASGTDTITVTYGGAVNRRVGGAISLTNVKQQAAEAVITNSNTGSSTISTDITTLTDGALVLDVVSQGDSDPNSFTTTTFGMVERWEQVSDGNGHTGAGSTKPVVSAGSTTMSWSHTGNTRMAHSLAAFAPAEMLIISGYIENSCVVPIKDVLVDANNGGGSDITDANGYYEVSVVYNWSGTVTPGKANYTFDPNSKAYTNVLDDVIDQNYVATNIYDLDCNGSIGLGDIGIMVGNWPAIGPNLPADFYEDDMINFLDFADFTNAWGI